jgi:hypothetical protein
MGCEINEDYERNAVPKPYVPEDGAIICLARDVPEGWETRGYVERVWTKRLDAWAPDCIVEARPIREPDVTITLPKHLVETWAENKYPTAHWGIVSRACRAALERGDTE